MAKSQRVGNLGKETRTLSGTKSSSSPSSSKKSNSIFSSFKSKRLNRNFDSEPLDDIPILEDDEQHDADYNKPIFPVFRTGKGGGASTNGRKVTVITDKMRSGGLPKDYEVSSPNSETLKQEIMRDFDEEFDKDTSENQTQLGYIGLHRQLVGEPHLHPENHHEEESSDETSTEEEENATHPQENDSSTLENYYLTEKADSHGTYPSRKNSKGSLIQRIRTGLSLTASNEANSTKQDMEKEIPDLGTSAHARASMLKHLFGLSKAPLGGGMVPGGIASSVRPSRIADEESEIGMNNEANEFQDEAKGLVNQLFQDRGTVSSSSDTGYSSSANQFTLVDHKNAQDDFDDLADDYKLDIDIPDSIAKKPRKVRRGIASSLLSMFNNGVLSQQTKPQKDRGPEYDQSTVWTAMNSSDGERKGRRLKRLGSFKPGHTSSSSLSYNWRKRSHSTDTFSGSARDSEKMRTSQSGSLNGVNSTQTDNNIISVRSGPDSSDVSPIRMPQFARKKDGKVGFFTEHEIPTNEDQIEFRNEYENLKKRRRSKGNFYKENAARITVHIADVLQRQQFILTLCKTFMMYGAPTHRMEEYMTMTARVLEINGSFIYFPGCMLASFGDAATRTTEMRLVRCPEGLNLGKLDEVHEIYKNVVHDREGVQEATEALETIMARKPRFNMWICILMYAFSSAMVAPWAFGGSWRDLPVCFGVGSVIGFLQFVVCPRSPLYSSLFEVTASIVSSFLARALGSINGGQMFCYSAIVQSSLALILPGYIILCGSLELQSRNMVAGAVRMFYAFIYSLMLSFGITLGAALYGWIDSGATSAATCTSNISPWYRFVFIPAFTIGIALVNQASFGQLPVMVFISGSGYVVSYFASKHFKNATELTAALGCFIIGLTSNGYSRLMKSVSKYLTRSAFMTVSLMLPGIFVQVPSGIASQGSVLMGISTANQIVHSNATTTTNPVTDTSSLGSIAFGMIMIEVALGISVGLYLSTVVVYPFGKKRTGLFTL
ncbi:DEKNAAC104565 [Brettanomyces naardenensis]|uniref:DEKNAAC104565 n=1 Tax=Brettanomyces naardenensis TaxID=13370 RepID=A0A448YR47_BRENA|nr:DEKNAAC104565 [Brettanomyces naardenensis]